MICKVCGEPFVELEETPENFHQIIARMVNERCDRCGKYMVVYDADGFVQSENVITANFLLTFFPQYKKACVVKRDSLGNVNFDVMRDMEMDELTPELAVKWANKLKTYVVLQ